MDKSVLIKGGILYDDALARFVGNKRLYEKYLVKFLDDRHMEDAKKAYEKKKLEEVLELVHALKGESGTLGIAELYNSCSAVVLDLRKNELSALEEKMKEIERTYEKGVKAIRNAMECE